MPAKKSAAKKQAAKRATAKRATEKATTATRKRAPKPTRTMSAQHKAALATGRTAGRAVRNYLEALESNKPRRGRKRTPESITARLDRIEEMLPDSDPMTRLALLQEQLDLEAERTSLEAQSNLAEYEAAFIDHAKTYSAAKGISYTAWRRVGVSADILRRAGISRGSSTE